MTVINDNRDNDYRVQRRSSERAATVKRIYEISSESFAPSLHLSLPRREFTIARGRLSYFVGNNR